MAAPFGPNILGSGINRFNRYSMGLLSPLSIAVLTPLLFPDESSDEHCDSPERLFVSRVQCCMTVLT